MTPQQFAYGLDRWGPDPSLWPAAYAQDARRLLDADPQARQALATAAAADEFLASLRRPTVPVHLEQRIVAQLSAAAPAAAAAQPPTAATLPLLEWLTARLWRPALAALIPIVAGFLLGLGSVEPVDHELAADLAMLAFSDLYAEFDDAQQ